MLLSLQRASSDDSVMRGTSLGHKGNFVPKSFVSTLALPDGERAFGGGVIVQPATRRHEVWHRTLSRRALPLSRGRGISLDAGFGNADHSQKRRSAVRQRFSEVLGLKNSERRGATALVASSGNPAARPPVLQRDATIADARSPPI
jgi:hypothetical protein